MTAGLRWLVVSLISMNDGGVKDEALQSPYSLYEGCGLASLIWAAWRDLAEEFDEEGQVGDEADRLRMQNSKTGT